MSPISEPTHIVVISDGTGRTAERVARAALLQFPDAPVSVEVFPRVTDVDRLERVVRTAAERQALLVTTLVGHELRRAAASLTKEHRLTAIDLLGGLLEQLGQRLRAPPDSVPNRLHEPGDAYFRAVEAVNFAVRADDGRDLALVPEADAVLLGMHGTSKTPLAVWMGAQGYRVANLPLRAGEALPAEVEALDPRRVVVLTVDPSHLAALLDRHGAEPGRLERILADDAHVDAIVEAHPRWAVVDVTGRSVDETGARVVRLLADRGIGRPGG